MAPENYERLQPTSVVEINEISDRQDDSSQRFVQVGDHGRRRKSWGKRVLPLLMTVAVVVVVSHMSPNTVGVKTHLVSKAGKSSGNRATTDDVSTIVVKSEEGSEATESQEAEAKGKEEGEKEGEGEEGTMGESEREEAEGEAEEGESEEEAEWTQTDVQIAGMLMGSCFMVMILFHVVNFPDDDIRFYAWNTISAVVSIFVAVLMFAMFNDGILQLCELYLPTNKSPSVYLCIIEYIHLTVWACLLQLVCAYLSGTICDNTPGNVMEDQYWVLADNLRSDFEKKIHSSFVRNQNASKSYTEKGEIAVRKSCLEREKRNRQVKCWGTLFAHITGFAAINSGGCMQHLEIFSSSPGMALIPIVLNQLYVNALFFMFTMMRKSAEEKAKQAGRKGARAKLFNEEVSEAEIDICCLGWSFLLCVCVRYKLVGVMPTMTGETPTPSKFVIGMQFLIGVGFALAAVIAILVKGMIKAKGEKGEKEEEEEGLAARYVEIFIGGLSMCFAWCFLFGGRWLYSSIEIFEKNGCSMETVIGRVMLAAFICTFVLCFIFLLDKIDDQMEDLLPGGNQVVRLIITALAVLAGFSWEHAFDGGVEAIAAQTDFPLTVTSILSVAVFVVVVPAWRRHILQKYMILLSLRNDDGRIKTTVFDSPAPEKLL